MSSFQYSPRDCGSEDMDHVHSSSDEDQRERSQQTPSPSPSQHHKQHWDDQDDYQGVPAHRQMTVTPVMDHVALVESVLSSQSAPTVVIIGDVGKHTSLHHLHPVGSLAQIKGV